MMGRESDTQQKLFYTCFNLEKRVRKDHILRKMAQHIDFNFIYKQVEDSYGTNGNVSVPPPVILKLMLLLILYNVRSERELMQTIPERLDWLWFLGFDLDDDIPHHSVLSKACNRWGTNAFKYFFEHIVWQCAEAGLIDGSKIFMDASLVQADASNNSVINQHSLKRYLNKSYLELEHRLEQQESEAKKGKANRKHISTTDPDASVVRTGPGRSKLRYKIHRAVDEKAEVITATEVTSGEVNEAHHLTSLIDQHQQCTGETAKKAVADSKYGTIDNYLACSDRKILPHFESLDKGHRGSGRRKGINELDQILSQSESRQAKIDISKRQHLMERSFARSKRYGYKRARWRRLWQVQIQEYLTATIQNTMVLVCNVKEQNRAASASSVRPGHKNYLFEAFSLCWKP